LTFAPSALVAARGATNTTRGGEKPNPGQDDLLGSLEFGLTGFERQHTQFKPAETCFETLLAFLQVGDVGPQGVIPFGEKLDLAAEPRSNDVDVATRRLPLRFDEVLDILEASVDLFESSIDLFEASVDPFESSVQLSVFHVR